ncbi:MAG: phytanoyl-CoA dioxygenase family protein [Planctomycetota bacterium]
MICLSQLRASLDEDGYAMVPNVFAGLACDALLRALLEIDHEDDRRRGGLRNLTDTTPAVARAAEGPAIREIIDTALSPSAFLVRAILFDKTPDANWLVPWHQDTTIAVDRRIDGLDGFGPWSIKAGVNHVRPPCRVLEQMVTVRLHLDDCPEDNGPLRVATGSHRNGITDQCPHPEEAVTCPANRGDALAMRPLLWHASTKSDSPNHRRVLHLEFADVELPPPLQWAVNRSRQSR